MKVISLLVLAMIVASPAYSQKKSKVDPKDVTIDSMSFVIDSISTVLAAVSGDLGNTTKALDSTTKELTAYKTMYSAVKEKVTMQDFDPTTMGQIIDSLRTSRDSTFTGLSVQTKTLNDSITVLNAALANQKMAMDSIVALSADKTPLINELKQLKELLDAGIITQEEFDTRKAKIMERW